LLILFKDWQNAFRMLPEENDFAAGGDLAIGFLLDSGGGSLQPTGWEWRPIDPAEAEISLPELGQFLAELGARDKFLAAKHHVMAGGAPHKRGFTSFRYRPECKSSKFIIKT
jgi:hypothetical protein